MNITILYATYSGSTEIAAAIVHDILVSKNHIVIQKNPVEVSFQELQNSDLIILCTPTWDSNGKDGQPHEDFMTFIDKFTSIFPQNKNFAVLGLGDSSYPNFCGSVAVLEAFITTVHGKLSIPSLKIDGFFYDQDKNSQFVRSWAQTIG